MFASPRRKIGVASAIAVDVSALVPAGTSLTVLSGDGGTRAFSKDGGSVTCR